MTKKPELPKIEAKSSGLQKTLLALEQAIIAQAEHLEKLIKGEATEPFNQTIIDESFKILDRIEKLKKFDDIYNLVFNPQPTKKTNGKKAIDLETQAEPEKEIQTINHMENVLDKVKNKVNGKKDG